MKDKIPDEIESALDDPDIPKIYSNSFSCALGIGDASVLLKIGKKPVCILNLSYTTAKTLAIKLQELIARLEDASGNKIMTTDEVGLFFKKEIDKKKSSKKGSKKNV
ncbi:MAG: hypothetical protein PVH87_07350 [Desulfobacteraceae bacterium]|jgi:hypothetical protein